MTQTDQRHDRTILFVNSLIQGSLLRRCVAYWGISCFVLWNILFLIDLSQTRRAIAESPDVTSIGTLYLNFAGNYFVLIFTASLLLPIFCWDALKLSHRIVGPFVPFTDALRRLRNGQKVEPITLRKNDLLIGFQKEFNEFVHWNNELNEFRVMLESVAAWSESDPSANDKAWAPLEASELSEAKVKIAELKRATQQINAMSDVNSSVSPQLSTNRIFDPTN